MCTLVLKFVPQSRYVYAGKACKVQRIGTCIQPFDDPEQSPTSGKENAAPFGVRQDCREKSLKHALEEQDRANTNEQLARDNSAGCPISASDGALQDVAVAELQGPRRIADSRERSLDQLDVAAEDGAQLSQKNSDRRSLASAPLRAAFQALPTSRRRVDSKYREAEDHCGEMGSSLSQELDTQLMDFDLPLSDPAFQETKEQRPGSPHCSNNALLETIGDQAGVEEVRGTATAQTAEPPQVATSVAAILETNVDNNQHTKAQDLRQSSPIALRAITDDDLKGRPRLEFERHHAQQDSFEDWEVPDDFDDLGADFTQPLRSSQHIEAAPASKTPPTSGKRVREESNSDLEAELDAFLEDMVIHIIIYDPLTPR